MAKEMVELFVVLSALLKKFLGGTVKENGCLT